MDIRFIRNFIMNKHLKFIILFFTILGSTFYPFFVREIMAGTDCSFTLDTNGTLETNLSEHWNLDETSGSRIGSFANKSLTDNNTVTSNPGKISNAGQFTRVNSEYLSIAVDTGDSLQ